MPGSETLGGPSTDGAPDATAAGAVASAPSAPLPARRSVRTVDFSQPTKFSSDQQRRISRALETFCQTATARLSAELRTPLELEVSGSMQLAWLMAQRKLSGSSLSALLDVAPTGTRMLLVGDLAFVLMGVECLLGGSPTRPPEERRLSEIDWVLIRRLFDSIVAQLSAAWSDLGHLQLSVGEIEQQSEAIQIASVSEPTLMIRIATRFSASEGSLTLLIPWMAIESVADQLSGHDAHVAHDDADSAVAIERALGTAAVTLRAEVSRRLARGRGRARPEAGEHRRVRCAGRQWGVGVHRGPPGGSRAPGPQRRSARGAHRDEDRQPPATAMSTPEELHEQLLQACVQGAHGALYERCDDGVQAGDMSRLADDAPLAGGADLPRRVCHRRAGRRCAGRRVAVHERRRALARWRSARSTRCPPRRARSRSAMATSRPHASGAPR